MVGEDVRDDDGTGSAGLPQTAADAVLEARRLLHRSRDGQTAETLGPVIDRLARVEVALAQDGADFAVVFVHLGMLLGIRWLNTTGCGASGASPASSAERAEALRRLRLVDRDGPPTGMLAAEARMVLLFLLTPWALLRTDGTRTALLHALLDATDGRVLTDAVRRDLVEARDVVDRITAASLDPELERMYARIKGKVERMLTAGAADAGPSAGGGAADAAASDRDRERDSGGAADDVDRSEHALLKAVLGLVTLAGARSTPQFTRLLCWLPVATHARANGGSHTALGIDEEASSLLCLAATGGGTGAAGVRRIADVALRAFRALPSNAPERARVARLHAYLLLAVEVREPGSVDFGTTERPAPDPDDDRIRLTEWPAGVTPEPGLAAHLPGHVMDFVTHVGLRERRQAALLDRLLAYRTGDPGYLEDAATLLGEAVGAAAAGSWWSLVLKADLVAVLEQAATYGGSLQDADASLVTLRGLGAALERDGSVPPDSPFALDLVLSTADRELQYAQRTGDHEALPRLVEELRGRYDALPPDSGLRGELTQRLGRLDDLLADPGQTGTPGVPGLAGPEDRTALVRTLAAFRRALDEPERYHDHEYGRRATLGLRLLFAVMRGENDPALLDEAVTELSGARALLAEGRGGTHRVDVLTKLAEAHMMRAARGGPGGREDARAFVEITREALDELAADVLLQVGADHGLSAALAGAVLARRLAFAAFLTRRPADAVADLEKGRTLVLQAADASRGIPERLDAAGRPDLARRWRAQVTPGPLRPEDAGGPSTATDGPPIPGSLRRQALAVLGLVRRATPDAPRTGQPADTADVAELVAGLAATDTDALVYLVPGMPLPDRTLPGFALILLPSTGPVLLPLPELLATGSPPLERYLDAAAERSRALADPAADASSRAACEARWQDALRTLCEWAGRAVMGPVLAAVPPPPEPRGPVPESAAPRPPRIVLVPCERLGAVPWHAAYVRGQGEHGHRYACQEAVLSYAPSGARFLAATARRRMPPAAGRQVLVADPGLSLPWAEIETAALRAACYPDALRYGEFFSADEAPDAAGTPAEILAALPGGDLPASVVHLSCHALAAPRPTDSALWLADPPGAVPGSGRLTVAGILDCAARRRPGDAGPLVVLSACETDLSTRHHDEALTLSTALVTGGAADVVGSRWAVRDGPTAVMTAVFHHHLTAGGLAPPDALRAAQMWMIDPGRAFPPALDGPLRHEATRSDLHHLHHWAAFTHQGNPAPAPTV
ncbi:CHAT domain-containing protein [Streptomyces sp. BE20]|uniref:CHAT domain-containing protein n=1 Tax=Streptomyces sp. BE20 TaxID=3002525 RepID=UPI002E76EE20|nr:CHAT domain-containing protein [Streptomyces sp. BE20]MEE1824947.1 CHAT domain-containing protein [Streptomyces sp. BE20]